MLVKISKALWVCTCSIMSDSLWSHGLYSLLGSVHEDFPGKNTGVGSNFLFQESESHSVVSNFLWPHGLESLRNSLGQNTGVDSPFPSPGDLCNPGIKSTHPALQVDSLPAEPWGKPKTPGVGNLSLLQGLFQIQKSNWGLRHCRWILYQLSCHGSPPPPGNLPNPGIKPMSPALAGRFFATGKPQMASSQISFSAKISPNIPGHYSS